MAFDGVAIYALADELTRQLAGGRIDKVSQPARDEIVLSIRAGGQNRRLLISVLSDAPRAYLTSQTAENPDNAPQFCMLLRKHISGGRIISASQPDFERVLVLEIESRNELGDVAVKKLCVEIMGRHSNIVLIDSRGKILGAIKQVDFSTSSVRQVLPGMMYELPPTQNKLSPLAVTQKQVMSALEGGGNSDKFILSNFTGISPIVSREMSFEFFGDTSADLGGLEKGRMRDFAEYICNYFKEIADKKFCFVVLTRKDGQFADFSAVDISQYGDEMVKNYFDSFSECADTFWRERDVKIRTKAHTENLRKFLVNNINRCDKKLGVLEIDLRKCENKEYYKMCGDLLMANLHQIPEKSREVTLANYLTGSDEKIEMSPDISPVQNAQKYYSRYSKAKTAEIKLAEQKKMCEEERWYLISVQEALEGAQNVKEINEIRLELTNAGYLLNRKEARKAKQPSISAPLSFATVDGFEVLVGKNNLQNDVLTLRTAANSDLWFHVQNIPGSHTVLRLGGREVSDGAIEEAAKICARHSKARSEGKVAVDYTAVKNVKKPPKAKPGMVIYKNFKTIIVDIN